MKTRLLTFLFAICCSASFAQLKLADKFFKGYRYAKAIEFYKIAAKQGDSSIHVLTRIGDAYYNNSNTDESVFWYGLAVDKYEKKINPEYIYKYIQSLVSTKQYEKAESWANKLKEKQRNNATDKIYIQDDFDIYKISKETTEERDIVQLI